jgi:hypothetical protein
MAWRNNARLSGKQMKGMFRKWRLPPPVNPQGVPREVQKQLAQENLTSDPVVWNTRLQELLSAYGKNGG